MRLTRLIISVVALAASYFFFFVYDPSGYDGRQSPGSSKFVTVGADGRYPKDSMFPSISETVFYLAALLQGGGEGALDESKQTHDAMAGAVKEALKIAEQEGVATGPTLFDEFNARQATSSAKWEKAR